MYCSNCGKQIENEAGFCTSCGTKISNGMNEEETATVQNAQNPNTINYNNQEYPYLAYSNEQNSENVKLKPFSTKAIIGFILPFIGYFVAGIICGIVGIVLCSLALKEVEAKGMRGKGLAIAGLVLSIICTVVCVGYFSLAY